MVVFLDGPGLEGQPPKAGAAAVRVKGVGQEMVVIVDKVVYGSRPMERYKRWRTWLRGWGRM